MAPSENVTIRHDRIFILDTNVLIHDPKAIFTFKGVVVGIPFVVLEELDKFKKEPGEKGFNARESIRILDEMREKGHLQNGVSIDTEDNGALLKVFATPQKINFTTTELHAVKDNLIIQTCQDLSEQNYNVTLVTKDLNCRVKADVLGLHTEDYLKNRVKYEEYYKGWIKVPIPALDLKKLSAKHLDDVVKKELMLNEYVIMHSEKNEEHARLFRYLGGKQFKEISNFNIMQTFSARNIQQLMVLDLLTDDSIQMITMLGQAGTGKTFLALIAGLHKVLFEKAYKKLLVTRPIVALGADIGYLPGDIQEKLHFWMQPVHDNLEFIASELALHNQTLEDDSDEDQYQHYPSKKKHHKKDHKKKHDPLQRLSKISEKHDTSYLVSHLQRKGILSLEAITYMRGRSIPNQFMFIDEVQNLTPHEVKTLVSRAGEGTKVILAGDPYQIDSPYLDFNSNGLTVTTDKMKDHAIFGTTFLETSERSELAQLTADVL